MLVQEISNTSSRATPDGYKKSRSRREVVSLLEQRCEGTGFPPNPPFRVLSPFGCTGSLALGDFSSFIHNLKQEKIPKLLQPFPCNDPYVQSKPKEKHIWC